MIAEKLEKMNKAMSALVEAQDLGDERSLASFGVSIPYYVDHSNRLSQEELRAILDWFLNGGKFCSCFRITKPMFERKNSKKRQKTITFWLEKGNLHIQIWHTIIPQNFQNSAWETIGVSLLKENEELGYYNGGLLRYVKNSGAELIELGEKK